MPALGNQLVSEVSVLRSPEAANALLPWRVPLDAVFELVDVVDGAFSSAHSTIAMQTSRMVTENRQLIFILKGNFEGQLYNGATGKQNRTDRQFLTAVGLVLTIFTC